MTHPPVQRRPHITVARLIPSQRDINFRTAVYMMLLCTLFGANAVAIKVSFEGFGIFTAAALRFGIAAGIIALWAGILVIHFKPLRGLPAFPLRRHM